LETVYVREEDISLDSQGLATWSINITAPIGGTYQGTFQFRTVLSPLQLIEADRDFRELLGKNTELVGSQVENLAYTIAQLKQRVVKSPPFWNDGLSRFPGSHIRDEMVLQAVYEAAALSEIMYRNKLKENHKASVERLKAHLDREAEEEAINQEVEEDSKPKKKAKKAK
jgi:hypothetical protein